MTNVTLRIFTTDDFTAVASIYAEGITTGVTTYETQAPDWNSWNKKFMGSCRIFAESKMKSLISVHYLLFPNENFIKVLLKKKKNNY